MHFQLSKPDRRTNTLDISQLIVISPEVLVLLYDHSRTQRRDIRTICSSILSYVPHYVDLRILCYAGAQKEKRKSLYSDGNGLVTGVDECIHRNDLPTGLNARSWKHCLCDHFPGFQLGLAIPGLIEIYGKQDDGTRHGWYLVASFYAGKRIGFRLLYYTHDYDSSMVSLQACLRPSSMGTFSRKNFWYRASDHAVRWYWTCACSSMVSTIEGNRVEHDEWLKDFLLLF